MTRRERRIARNVINSAILVLLLIMAVGQRKAIHNLQKQLEGGQSTMAMICANGSRECTGCMQCQKDPEPVYCEVCGKEVEHLYKNRDGEIVGCDNCIKEVDPYT